MRSKMRASVPPYALGLAPAFAGVDGEGAGAPTGIAQPATRRATAEAAKNLGARIHNMTLRQRDRSNASRTRRGSRLARFAVKTRSHLALLYNSSESEGRLIVPIQPSPVSRSTLPLRRRTGMSSPSICVFTG